jgi:hypothetical protein
VNLALTIIACVVVCVLAWAAGFFIYGHYASKQDPSIGGAIVAAVFFLSPIYGTASGLVLAALICLWRWWR